MSPDIQPDPVGRQLRARARDLADDTRRLDAAARILTTAGTSCEHLAIIATAIGGLARTAITPVQMVQTLGRTHAALATAAHEHIGQADDLTEHTLSLLDSALADLEHAQHQADTAAVTAAQRRAWLCEVVIEDTHITYQRLHDIQDRLALREAR